MSVNTDPIYPKDLVPQRRSGLVRSIANLVFRNQPDKGPQPEQKDSTLTGVTAQSVQTIFDKYFITDVERLTVYKDVQEMDENSEELSTALDTISDNACASEDGSQVGIEIVCEDSASLDILNEVLDRTDIAHRLYPLVRNTIKFGDGFAEVVVNREGDIAAFKQLPANSMYRNEDKFGNLVLNEPKYNSDGSCLNGKEDCAFVQIDLNTQKVIGAFYPWQIVHSRWNWDGISPYGRSMFKVTRVIWRKLKAEEEALIIGRLTRAMMKLVFYVDTSGLSRPQKETALKDFRDSILTKTTLDGRRDNPLTVLSDLFLSDANYRVGGQVVQSRTRVEILDPKNEGLQVIADIEYFHRKMLSTIIVPPAHLGFEKDVNAKSTLTIQDVQYVRKLRRIQQCVSQALQQMFDTALILKGKDPKTVEYKIVWPTLSAADEAIASLAEMQRAQGDQVYVQMGAISKKYVQKHRFSLTDEEIDELQAEVDEEQKADLEKQQAVMDIQTDGQTKVAAATAQSRAQSLANGSGKGANNTPKNPKAKPSNPSRKAMRQDSPATALMSQTDDLATLTGLFPTPPPDDKLLEEAQNALSEPVELPNGKNLVTMSLEDGQ